MQTTRDFMSSSQSFDSELSLIRPCHVLLETLTSDCGAGGSSVVQSRQDEVFDGPGEANSDSGDSVFITQKSVPEAVRPGKRRFSRMRSDSKTQHEDPAKQEAETTSFSSDSDEETKTTLKKKKKIFKVPNIRFSFLTKTSKTKPIITKAKNMKLQLYTMGGFFSSVHELWKSFELGGDLAESLSTVDADGENISPISEEEEEETLEEEDLKVVERKHFVTLLKTKSSQLWSLFDKRSVEQRRRISSLNGSQEKQQRTVHKNSTKMPLIEMPYSSTESSDDEDDLGRGMETIRSSSPQEVSTENIHTQTERPDTKTQLPKIQEGLLSDNSDSIMKNQEAQTAPLQLKIEDLCMDEKCQSESTVCGFENQKTPQRDDNGHKVEKRKKKNKCVEEGSQEPEGQCDVVSSGCVDITEEEITLINEQDTSVSNRKKKKKKKKKKNAQEEKEDDKREQSGEELEVDAVSSSKTGSDSKEKKKTDVGVACVKTRTAAEPSTDDGNIKKKKKKKRLNSDVSQTSTEHQEYLENTEVSQESVESSFTKRKKKKKNKKKKYADEEAVVQQEQSDKEVAKDSASSSKTGTGGKKKKKKDDVGVACVKTNTAAESPTDDGNIKKKKKKKRLTSDVSQTSTEHQEYLENTEVSQETRESKFPKKKKSAFETRIGEGDRLDLDISNDAATLETKADLTVEKKKKKKKRGISETEDTSHRAEENKDIDNTQKEAQDAEPKAKKKKMRGNSSKIIQENILAPVKFSVSVQKKKKKRTSSFLTADEEGKKSRTHEKNPPDVSIDALAATSADASGSLGESKNRKKKKKRRSAGSEYLERELEFKELKETSKHVVKKKKKPKTNDSKLMNSTERSESLADAKGSQTEEAVVLNKKKKKDAKEKRETLGHHVSLPSSEPGNQTPKEKRKTKENTNNKHLLKVKSLTKTVSSKKRTEPADSSFNLAPLDKPETSSIRQKTTKKKKRRLYNTAQSLDLFSDC